MNSAHTPAGLTLPVRNLRLAPDQKAIHHWFGGDPVGTAVMNALSLTFPDGEKLFIDAVRHFRGAAQGELVEQIRDFIRQEAVHAREHEALNRLIDRQRYPGADRVAALTRARTNQAREHGPMTMLLVTIALEHFTAIMANQLLQEDTLSGKVPADIARLWRWHAVEETEHKAVAFDVYQAVTRNWSRWRQYRVRCLTMLLVSVSFTRHITEYACMLLEADGYSQRQALQAVRKHLWSHPGLFRRGWRSWLAWFKPGFHPWSLPSAPAFPAWKAEFDALAGRTAE